MLERFGNLKISKKPWPGVDESYGLDLTPDRRRIRHQDHRVPPFARSTLRDMPPTISASWSKRSAH